jgi:ubiquinone biosynthesis monooxygenase Coq7
MRVNHVGEVCAQALYQGQSITSRSDSLRIELERAAQEEVDHLAWAERRIAELGGRKSLLNPFWYGGALAIGLLAGACGDRWSLGFLAETERQVGEHLGGHLSLLPEKDGRSREIVSRMRMDELSHAAAAVRLGAAELPLPVRLAMRGAARLMTGVAYRV